jgi:hypothetical protein
MYKKTTHPGHRLSESRQSVTPSTFPLFSARALRPGVSAESLVHQGDQRKTARWHTPCK